MSESTHTYIMLTDQDIKEVRALPAGELLTYAQEVSDEILQFEKEHPLPLNPEEERILGEMKEWVLLFTEEDARRVRETQSKLLEDMTVEELADAYTDICDERRYFSRSLRGKNWTKEDTAQYESMNQYAQAITDEQESRNEIKS